MGTSGRDRFLQDIQVTLYWLRKNNLQEALRQLKKIRKVSQYILDEHPDKDRGHWEATRDLIQELIDEAQHLRNEGKGEEEICTHLYEEFGGEKKEEWSELGYDITADQGGGNVGKDVSWKSTSKHLQERNEWLEKELERREEQFMELYEEHVADSNG